MFTYRKPSCQGTRFCISFREMFSQYLVLLQFHSVLQNTKILIGFFNKSKPALIQQQKKNFNFKCFIFNVKWLIILQDIFLQVLFCFCLFFFLKKRKLWNMAFIGRKARKNATESLLNNCY